MNNIKFALVSDFDGTISKKDFFYMVTDDLIENKKDTLKYWNDYLNGKIKHIEALSAIFSQIHLSQQDFDKFINTIEIDSYFYDTLQLCNKTNIPVYICSAGTKYYIKKRIHNLLNQYQITLISNNAVYSRECGMKLIAPDKNYEFYNANTGISKEKLVLKLKNEGYTVIYAGDGKPDLKSARIADIIFAKETLLELCKKENIKTEKFENFKDISEFIKNIYEK